MEKTISIEEINNLIDEIERENLKYSYVIKGRKKKRIQAEKKTVRRKILSVGVPLSLMGIISLQTFLDTELNNIYNGNDLKISEERINELEYRIEKRLNLDIKEDKIEDYLVLNAILENLNLTEQEKRLIGKEMIDIIEINPYLNKERVYQALLKLKIFYMDRPKNKRKNLLGECIAINSFFLKINNVYIYSEKSEDVLEHELIHIILLDLKNYDAPYFIKEGLTELLTNEFFSENPYVITISYPLETLSIKMLCEIIGSDTVLKAYTTGNMNEIYDALYNLVPYIKPKEFINELNKELEKFSKNKENDLDKIAELIKAWRAYYFNSKEVDPKAFLYYLQLFKSLETKNPYNTYMDQIEEKGYIPKTYYNKEISQTNSLVKVKKI